jgi:hypothetical protein
VKCERPMNKCIRAGFGHRIPCRIKRVKEGILAQSRQTVNVPEHMLRLAINEAEALAWQTRYPDLLFPALAIEKVEAVAAWNARQQLMRSSQPVAAFAE